MWCDGLDLAICFLLRLVSLLSSHCPNLVQQVKQQQPTVSIRVDKGKEILQQSFLFRRYSIYKSCFMFQPSKKIFLLTLLIGVSVVLSEGFAISPSRSQAHAMTTQSLSQSRQAHLGNNGFPARPITVPITMRDLSLNNRKTQSVQIARGGALKAADTSSGKCPVSKPIEIFGSIWGSLGVVYILAKSIRRVLPIALEPFKSSTTMVLTPVQWW